MSRLEEHILSTFGFDPSSAAPTVAAGTIRKEVITGWMATEDLAALGALHYLIVDRGGYAYVSPPLSDEELVKFSQAYYGRCLLTDAQGSDGWNSTRYGAAWSIVNWFRKLWHSSDIDKKWPSEAKRWLGDLYRRGDKALRECLVNATLEHLFEDLAIARFFSDWRNDPVLRAAYHDAKEWTRGAGQPPLG